MGPDVEQMAAAVHDGSVARLRAHGIQSLPHPVTGDEQLVAYADASDAVKEDVRAVVRSVVAALALETRPADVAAAFPAPPEMKRSYPPRRPITPVWVAHDCPNCHRGLLIDRISLTVIQATDRPPEA